MASIRGVSLFPLLRAPASNTREYDTAFRRLSSGLRISSSSDDPAALSVQSKLNTSGGFAKRGKSNPNNTITAPNIASDAIGNLTSINSRLKKLTAQGQTSTLSSSQRGALKEEADALVSESNRIVSSAKQNGKSAIDSSITQMRSQGPSGPGGVITALLQNGSGSSTAPVSQTVSIPAVRVTPPVPVVQVTPPVPAVQVTPPGPVVPATPGVSDRTYKAPSYFTTTQESGGNGTTEIRAGDFNGDGKIDLAVFGNHLVFHLGNGDGTFGSAITLQTGNNGKSGRVLDFNNDGNLDIFVGGMQSRIFYGNGNGTFSGPQTYGWEENFGTHMSLIDMNGDGKLDRVQAGYSGINIYQGNGDGTFKARTILSNAGNGEMAEADFNGDNKPDIIALDGGSRLKLSLNTSSNGNLSFSAAQTLASVESWHFVEAGDLNNDGKMDFVAGTNKLFVALGNGDGTFALPPVHTLHSGWGNVDVSSPVGSGQLVDLDKDGYLDFIGTTAEQYSVNINFGNGDGTFKAPISVKAATDEGATKPWAGLWETQVVDVNGDDILDILAVYAENGGKIAVFLGNGTPGNPGAPGLPRLPNVPVLPASTTTYYPEMTVNDNSKLNYLDISSTVKGFASKQVVNRMFDNLSQANARVEASRSYLGFALDSVDKQETLLTGAESSIRSVEIAEETARSVSVRIKVERTTALTAQATKLDTSRVELFISSVSKSR